VLDSRNLSIADHHVGATLEDRRDELRDVGGRVLIIGVGVDDHIRAELQRRVQPRLKGRREPLVVGQPDEVVDAALARGRGGPVGGAVVDDQPLDAIEPIQFAG
jgi:hypothetical protein